MKKSRRSLSLWLSLGLVTLAGSGLGATWLMRVPVGLEQQAKAVPTGASAAAGPGVVCFGYVDLENGATPLYPLQPGRVAKVLVRANDKVAANAPLLCLEDEAAQGRVDEAQAGVMAAQAQLAQARQAPEQHRLQLAIQQDAITATRNQLSAAQHLLARKQELARSNLLNAQEAAAAEDQVKALDAQLAAESKKLGELKLRDPAQDILRAQAAVALAQARLRQAKQALSECTLKAPQAGTVARILVSPGEVLLVPARQAAIVFAADEPRIVRAEIEQEFAGKVAAGQAVRIQDDTDSQLTCRGKVALVSDWFMQRRAIFQEPTRFNDNRTIECIITLDPGHPPLRIGQRVRVLIGAVES